MCSYCFRGEAQNISFTYLICTSTWDCQIPAGLDIIQVFFQKASFKLIFTKKWFGGFQDNSTVVSTQRSKGNSIKRGEKTLFGDFGQKLGLKAKSRKYCCFAEVSSVILINGKHSFLYWPFKRLLRSPLEREALIIRAVSVSFHEI